MFVTIRQAEVNEASELAALGFVAWEQSIYPLNMDQQGSRDDLMNRMAGYCHDRVSDIIVAEGRGAYSGAILGWCSRFPGKAYIPYLFVSPEVQRQGVGGLLLRRMESMLEFEGKSCVQLETPADHVEAVRFYEQQGYHILAMRSQRPSAQRLYPSVRLEKRLNPFCGIIRH
jgi:2-amino-4-hydroxy-6-hydroxymethyldihydropteridine diphosphokinase